MRAPLQAVGAQRRGVVRRDVIAAGRGHRVVRIGPGDHLQDRGGVGDGSRHRAGDVGAEVQRHDPDRLTSPIVDRSPTSA